MVAAITARPPCLQTCLGAHKINAIDLDEYVLLLSSTCSCLQWSKWKRSS
jgi:hypothetical protein